MSKILRSDRLSEGASARVQRLLPTAHQGALDPFVFFDHFYAAAGAGFPDHPHRGFEAITLLLCGELRHADNLGNKVTLKAGEVQAFTAGRGMIHSELAGKEAVEGLQLWINLAHAHKGREPGYQPPRMPRKVMAAGYEMQLIVGADAPIQLQTPCFIAVLELAPGERFAPDVPVNWQGFAYVLRGELHASDGVAAMVGEGLSLAAGDALMSPHGAQAFVALGRPHGEPIVMRGSYVD